MPTPFGESRPKQLDYIKITGARENNLKDVSLSLPKRQTTVFTGVSGAGKSSLVFNTIAAESQRQLNATFTNYLPLAGQPDADAIENLSAAVVINQKQIRGNARSTVGTITDIFSVLRLLYSRIGEPHVGYSNTFSFNEPEGMCPKCDGLGETMDLDLEKLLDAEKSLNDVGLGYLTLGQPLSSLSGGECQRFKLSNELHKSGSVYVLDEPTTGLHMADLAQMLSILNRLVDAGNSVIVIEHNLDVVRNADWVIDLGPAGGTRGGTVIFEGTPRQLLTAEDSFTAEHLRLSVA